MFLRVMIMKLIIICAADSRILQSELKSEQEFPVLQFNKNIVFPMIKNPQVSKYSALSSVLRPVRAASPNGFRKMQYAPLNEILNQKMENADKEYTEPMPTLAPTSVPVEPTELLPYQKNNRLYGKSYLEPRPEATSHTKCFAHKVQASPLVSRSPGHNAVYRVISEAIQRDENPFKITDYVKPIGVNLNFKSFPTTIVPLVDLASEDELRPLTLNERFVVKPKASETVVQEKSKRYLPHGKYHRLHLNIARVYSPGQVPPKPPAHPAASHRKIDRRPPLVEAYLPHAYQDYRNTKLYPVNNHRKGFRLRQSFIHL